MIDQKTLDEFSKIYDETYNDVLRYVVCKCSNISDVEDIIQNIYLDVYKKLPNISKSYIMGISKNKVNDYYRYNYKRKILEMFCKEEIEVDYKSDVDIESATIMKYDVDLVWKYLKKKKAVISKVFCLYFKLGLTIKEISLELGISESNVKHYLYRTIRELNEFLKGDYNE